MAGYVMMLFTKYAIIFPPRRLRSEAKQAGYSHRTAQSLPYLWILRGPLPGQMEKAFEFAASSGKLTLITYALSFPFSRLLMQLITCDTSVRCNTEAVKGLVRLQAALLSQHPLISQFIV